MDRFYNRLTRSLLRSTTLSTASGKEGLEKFFYPLCGVAGERVAQRSAGGVSRSPTCRLLQNLFNQHIN